MEGKFSDKNLRREKKKKGSCFARCCSCKLQTVIKWKIGFRGESEVLVRRLCFFFLLSVNVLYFSH